MSLSAPARIPLAILAGGYGKRLGALTRRLPKSLLPVQNACFLDYQLAWARRQGVRRVVICLGHLAAPIRRHLRAIPAGEMCLRISDEGHRPLGTVAALRRALPQLGERFFVLYGDSYLPVEYAAAERAQRASRCPALMVVYRNDGRYERSNVEPRHGRVCRYVPGGSRQMRWIDAGLSVLSAGALKAAPADDLPALFAVLAAEGQLACHRVRRRFYEVGSPAGFSEFCRRAARLRVQAGW